MNALTKKNITLPEKSTGRVIYLDILKTIAIIGVLLIHITSRGYTCFEFLSFDYLVSVFLNSVVRFSVPVFVMVSGTLFLSENKEIPVKKMYQKYILRIILTLIIFSCFYEAFDIIAGYFSKGVFEKAQIEKGISNLINLNTHFHLYYLYIIVIIYVLVPVIKVFLKSASRRNFEYLLGFLYLFAIILPFIKSIFPDCIIGKGMTGQYIINLTYGMLFYFLLGHYFNKYPLSKKAENIIIAMGILASVLTFLLSAFETKIHGRFVGRYIESMTVNVSFMASGIFIFVKRISNYVKSGKIFTLVSGASFLIYLIHDIFNIILDYLGLNLTTFPTLISIPVLLVLVFGLSYISYLVLKKVPFFNKLL